MFSPEVLKIYSSSKSPGRSLLKPRFVGPPPAPSSDSEKLEGWSICNSSKSQKLLLRNHALEATSSVLAVPLVIIKAHGIIGDDCNLGQNLLRKPKYRCFHGSPCKLFRNDLQNHAY